ncbi:MAG TPA: DUF4199 domain-containing protein [Woeseiaceae bacterium]|nr:DUF4199 domain-containing protein [Woeseiaceae bacterium]
MQRIILIYGVGAGLAVILSVILGLMLSGGEGIPPGQQWLGYLIMLIALSLIFVGIKRYRDEHLDGCIPFGTAMLVGLGIAAVAGIVYVAVWEIYLALTDYTFIDAYTRGVIASQQAEGATAAELQAVTERMQALKARYASPLFRLPMTFLAIFPVGALITFISAAILRGRTDHNSLNCNENG